MAAVSSGDVPLNAVQVSLSHLHAHHFVRNKYYPVLPLINYNIVIYGKIWDYPQIMKIKNRIDAWLSVLCIASLGKLNHGYSRGTCIGY